MTIIFSDAEIKGMSEDPFVLRDLAEWHKVQATMVDSMGFEDSVKYHETRKQELRNEATIIEEAY